MNILTCNLQCLSSDCQKSAAPWVQKFLSMDEVQGSGATHESHTWPPLFQESLEIVSIFSVKIAISVIRGIHFVLNNQKIAQ